VREQVYNRKVKVASILHIGKVRLYIVMGRISLCKVSQTFAQVTIILYDEALRKLTLKS